MDKRYIYVYIPGFEYDSKGPLEIDAIKLTATINNAQIDSTGEIYNAIDTYCFIGNNKNTIKCNTIYKADKPDLTTQQRYPGASVAVTAPCFTADTFNRSPHGTFYDFSESNSDGKTHHIITYKNIKSEASNIRNLNYEEHDGLFVIEILDELNTTIKLNFTLYSRIGDAEVTNPIVGDLETIDITKLYNPDLSTNFIEVGTWTLTYNPAISGTTVEEATLADSLPMYFNLSKFGKTSAQWEIPVDGDILISKFDDNYKIWKDQKCYYALFTYNNNTYKHEYNSNTPCNNSAWCGNALELYYHKYTLHNLSDCKFSTIGVTSAYCPNSKNMFVCYRHRATKWEAIWRGRPYYIGSNILQTISKNLIITPSNLNSLKYLYTKLPKIVIQNLIKNIDFNDVGNDNQQKPILIGMMSRTVTASPENRIGSLNTYFNETPYRIEGPSYPGAYTRAFNDNWDNLSLYINHSGSITWDYIETINNNPINLFNIYSSINYTHDLNSFWSKGNTLEWFNLYNIHKFTLGLLWGVTFTSFLGNSNLNSSIFDGTEKSILLDNSNINLLFNVNNINEYSTFISESVKWNTDAYNDYYGSNHSSWWLTESWGYDHNIAFLNSGVNYPFIDINNLLYINLSKSDILYNNVSDYSVHPFIFNDDNGYSTQSLLPVNIDISKNYLDPDPTNYTVSELAKIVSDTLYYPWELVYNYNTNSTYDSSFCHEKRFFLEKSNSIGIIKNWNKNCNNLQLKPGLYVLKVEFYYPNNTNSELTCNLNNLTYTLKSYNNQWLININVASSFIINSIKYDNLVKDSTTYVNIVSSIGLFKVNLDLEDTNTLVLNSTLNQSGYINKNIVFSDSIYLDLIIFPCAYVAKENIVFLDRQSNIRNSDADFNDYTSNINKFYNFMYLPSNAYYQTVAYYIIPETGYYSTNYLYINNKFPIQNLTFLSKYQVKI